MVQSGLVGWWPLHEWSGQANDLSGNDNHGTVNGATQGVAGKSGLTGYSFNGSDDIDVGSNGLGTVVYDFSESFTLSWWSFVRDNNGSHRILSPITDYAVSTNYNSGSVGFTNYPNGGVNSPYEINQWEFFTAVYDPSTGMSIYRNGALEDSNSISATPNGTSQQDTDMIGDDPYQDKGHNGGICDVRVYNRALSPQEIQTLYEMGSVDVATPPSQNDSGAVSRWTFNDRSDTSTAVDEWGSNDGTINGAVYSSDSVRDDGYSMSFDGSDDHITIGGSDGSQLDITSSLTVSAWIKTSVGADGNKYCIYVRAEETGSDSNPRFRVEDGNILLGIGNESTSTYQTVSGSTNVADGNWYHVAGVFDDSADVGKVYANGVVDEENTSMTVSPRSYSETPEIGSYDGWEGRQRYFDGNISDFRLYNRVLTSYEIQQLYLYGTRGVDRRFEVIRR